MKSLFALSALVVMSAFAMTTLAPLAYAQGNGKAYGHFVAPGWLKKNEPPSDEGVVLPPGIKKKMDGDTGGNDRTAPVVSGIAVDLTATTAVITWSTDEDAESTVYVSTESPIDEDDEDTLRVHDDEFETSHSASFTGLTPSTTYYAHIVVADSHGNDDTTDEFSFVTDSTSTPDTTAPIISAITTNPDEDSVLVTWDTNESSNSRLYLSTSSPVNIGDGETIVVTDASLATDHALSATGLDATTTYYGFVTSADGSGNVSTSSEFSFTTDATPDTTGPIISNVVIDARDDTATATWSTNEPANSTVYLSTASSVDVDASGTIAVSESALVTGHTLVATGLLASTTYYGIVTSKDGSGNTSTSSEFSFTTDPTPDTTDPVITDIVTNAGTSTIDVTWSTNEPATSVGYLSTTTGFGTGDVGVMTATNLSLTGSHELSFTGLTASTTYFLRVESVDASTNATLSNEVSVITQ